jgi:spore coat polysaccharide biosynthesis protein SpsF
MGSTRLPGKIMRPLCGKTVLAHVVERVSQARLIGGIIIATTDLAEDDAIARHAEDDLGLRCYRGSADDVLARYCGAARKFGLSGGVVRITSDCPLYDPFAADEAIRFFLGHGYDIVTNGGSRPEQRTYPRGLDTEIFTLAALEGAFERAGEPHQREHVTPYIYETSPKAYYYRNRTDLSRHRWTLDTPEDWDFVSAVYGQLYRGVHDFYCADIIRMLDRHPEIFAINSRVEQKALT